MFISNIKDIKSTNLYQCNNMVGNYLIKQGIPLLSRGDNKMVFAKTIKLQKAIDNMPFYLRIFAKGGVVNG